MELRNFFEENNKIALAFSGGVDSAYLIYAAKKYGADIKAYYVRSAFQPEFEYQDAVKMAAEVDVQMETIVVDVLSDATVVANPSNRCYYCKRKIFTAIKEKAAQDGYAVIIDGTNASDDVNDRPGMKAIAELGVLSPLRICGLTKAMVREKSKEAGLFTWDKPAYACLATRIAAGEAITKKKLEKTEGCEGFLHSLGFRNIRIRQREGRAKVQIMESQRTLLNSEYSRIMSELEKYYDSVEIDSEVRNEE